MGAASILLLATLAFACLTPTLTTKHDVLQSILSKALSNVFNGTSFGMASQAADWPYTVHAASRASLPTDKSYVEGLCSNLPSAADRTRVACCGTSNGNVLYLNNVQISRGKLVFYTGDGASPGSSANLDGSSRLPPSQLPPITSLVRRKVTEFRLPLELRASNFTQAKCTSYFDGTLHVIGRQTTQNLYHALNDNVLPLLSLILLDASLRPELLLAPRALLTGFQPATDREQVPHLEALLRAAVPRQFTLGASSGGGSTGGGAGDAGEGSVSSADGVCFRRVAWGGGVKVVYQHLLGALRRQSSDLLRELALLAFQPPNPYIVGVESQRRLSTPTLGLARSSSNRVRGDRLAGPRDARGNKQEKSSLQRRPAEVPSAVSAPSATVRSVAASSRTSLTVPTSSGHPRPMNIVIYTRGTSGVGRTIAGEALLRDRLRQLGASAFICCDFRNVTFAEQLGYAMHADVVVGLHGAGLVNSILAPTGVVTVELKTIYGYGLTLFAVCTEARQGTFVELDIRDHHIWGAPGQSRNRPIDDALINRVTAALFAVLDQRSVDGTTATRAGTGSYLDELRALQGASFGDTLFAALPRPAPRPGSPAVPPAPTGKKLLGGGDLVVHPYPTMALEQAASASHVRPGTTSNTTAPSTTSRAAEAARGLDFLLHALGPVAMEAPAQCARMSLSAYWTHVAEKSVREKYCLTC